MKWYGFMQGNNTDETYFIKASSRKEAKERVNMSKDYKFFCTFEDGEDVHDMLDRLFPFSIVKDDN